MLFQKMMRDIRHNFMQFFTVFLLAFLAVYVFAGIGSATIGTKQIRNQYHKDTNLADGWLYGDGFTEEELTALRNVPGVSGAQLRSMIETKGEESTHPTIELYIETENIISKPYIVEGEAFDPKSKDGIWLNNRFAEAQNIEVGDTYTLDYAEVSVTKIVKGLVMSPEYEYYQDATDLEPDFSSMGYAYMGLDALADTIHVTDEKQLLAMIPMTQVILTTSQSNVLNLEDTIADAIDHDYAVFLNQKSQSGIQQLSDEINQHDQFTIAFPAIFLIIALLVIVTTMNRMVTEQRIQIGTMKALGMKKSKILFHYCSYSFVLSAVGAVIGLWIAPETLGRLMNTFMPEMYTLPEWKAGYSDRFYLVVVLTIMICTLATYLSCRKILGINPADTLRPAAPKSGKKCIFEKLPFWDGLGFSNQYNLRDISRSKLRAFMCLFGTMCGMMMLVCGIGCSDTLKNVNEWEFDKLQNFQNEVVLKDKTSVSDAEEIRNQTAGELVMMSAIEIANKKDAPSKDRETVSINVTEGKGIYGITDVDQNVIDLKGTDVAITRKLADKLGVSVGDKVYWHLYDKENWTSSTITDISRNPQMTGIIMTRAEYEKSDYDYLPSICVTNQDTSGISVSGVSSIHTKADIQEAFNNGMQVMYLIVATFIVFAIILNIVVLYDAGILSFNERVKEFATLKVLGFQTNQIRKLLFQQNLWLSIAGVIIGAPFGKIMLQYMFDSNGDSMDYIAVVSVPAYLICAVAVIACSALVSILFSRKLRKLDMVETLKGLE